MTRQIKKDILNVRKHKPQPDRAVAAYTATLGWVHHLEKLERGKKYELFSTEKADRRIKQRAKQEQERMRLSSGESPWCGWCN